jgi:integrase
LGQILSAGTALTEVSGQIKVGPPKTQASNRSISLPSFLVNELAYHLEGHNGGYVFTSPNGKPLRRHNFRRRHWLKAVKAAEFDHLTFHSLRHSHAGMLIAAGEHVKLISTRLGHSSVRTTLDTYGFLLPGLDEAAADRLDQLVSEGLGSDPGQIPRGEARAVLLEAQNDQ